ncbi:TPA-induced transmembrane protein isoform X1 [Kogia breviceps]|uniref:TPA-induced transmembrane protein isoform X1 n=2 Tax=Kogia breviceps TaxID=27615 RepID=UPI0034D25D43
MPQTHLNMYVCWGQGREVGKQASPEQKLENQHTVQSKHHFRLSRPEVLNFGLWIADKESPWNSCNKNLVGKCKLWMVLASLFLGFVIVIIISLCLTGVTYVDEDENEILELSSNKTFLVMLKIPEECVTEEKLPDLLTKRITDVYSSSPALSRYFTSVEIIDFSGENSTITYHLHFGFPSEDHNFMKYVMSEELVLGVLQQDFHDQNVPGCETLGLDPASLWFSE